MDEKVRLTVSANSPQRASAEVDSEFGVEEPDRPAHSSLWTGAVTLEQEGAIPELLPQSWEHQNVQTVLAR